MYELQSNIWVHEVELDGYCVRGVLICSTQKAVVWDTLSHPHDMVPFLPLIGDKELFIAYSHGDWDHVWGTAGLPYRRAHIIGHNHCQDRFAADIPVTLSNKKSKDPGRWSDVKLIPPSLSFQEEFSIELGSSSLTFHHLPGHTPDSIVAFYPDTGLLLMGDAAETPFPVIPEKRPVNRWIKELQRWLSDPRVLTVVPSHGAIGGPEILQQNISYLQNLQAGRENILPTDLTDFYIETHRENLRVCRAREQE